MSAVWFALPFAVLLWWASTAVVLHRDRLPAATHRRTLAAATVVLALALAGFVATRSGTTALDAYVAFACGILVWGWVEVTFLTGICTGPRKVACRAGCRGWPHVRHAIEAILYHELLIAACAVTLVALTSTHPNRIGMWTFLALWAMRLSAKLNLFLGVRNSGEELLPAHMRYLGSFFGRRSMNALFPISVAASLLAIAALVQGAFTAQGSAAASAGGMLLASLVALGLLEHVFLMLPVSMAALWRLAPVDAEPQLAETRRVP